MNTSKTKHIIKESFVPIAIIVFFIGVVFLEAKAKKETYQMRKK